MPLPVDHLVVMGVSGCGKTTVASLLGRALERPVAEADDFHTESSIRKMRRGIPLSDEDRAPWLEALRAWMNEQAGCGVRTVVTCSALQRSYRDLLAGAEGRVLFVHLLADEEDLRRRMTQRSGHFMPASLLPSQLAALEPLEPDEDGIVISSRPTPGQTARAVLTALRQVGGPSVDA
ncbi:MAG: gluconokinase [Actinomyces sp.]|uniref:gluconokinase n=1 Tax=Actinomyces sp. TaxID=29317 RepID=UPI0026DBDD04|nr:gluconokinase [Actinomyces sp.]MDO4244355.1 gluconokinase [Actinomyces sp.]